MTMGGSFDLANWLWLTIIAHLLSDFVFQTGKMVEWKKEKKMRGYILHFLIVFFVTFLLTGFFLKEFGFSLRKFHYSRTINNLLYNLAYTSTIAFLHIIIDLIKEIFANKSPKSDLIMFFIDQLIHLGIIYIAWKIVVSRYLETININTWSYLEGLKNEKSLLFIIVYLVVLFVAAVLLEKVLKMLNIERTDEKETNISRYIGIIERALIVTLVSFGHVSSIGIIFTAKSLARYRELRDDKFVEYYLLGTLASLLIALVGGLFISHYVFSQSL
ncbi:MAG: DUF3307 domain-containing protein [Halanaerobiales bacterium]